MFEQLEPTIPNASASEASDESDNESIQSSDSRDSMGLHASYDGDEHIHATACHTAVMANDPAGLEIAIAAARGGGVPLGVPPHAAECYVLDTRPWTDDTQGEVDGRVATQLQNGRW